MRKPKANNIGKGTMMSNTMMSNHMEVPMSNEERARKQKEISQENRQRRKKQYLGLAIKLSLCGVAVYSILKKIKK
tara:strand:+ start:2519 stop:2746 length:228 start_codon:yes stop_codon:yes gene_type:complete